MATNREMIEVYLKTIFDDPDMQLIDELVKSSSIIEDEFYYVLEKIKKYKLPKEQKPVILHTIANSKDKGMNVATIAILLQVYLNESERLNK
tara:strand:+ start:2075 stop:2350 length:276 start_codon:yes stop_codon:yes gene_type:complete